MNTPRRTSRPIDNVVVWRWDSDPFGAAAANEDPDGDGTLFVYNLRFPGQYSDPETNLNYNYARDYDPAVGRYLESDPLGLEGGLDPYAYVNSNPLSAVDPKGLSPVEGSWITPPHLQLTGIQITNARLSLSLSAWGHLGLVNVYGNLEGYVNIDVRCKQGCRTWEIHDRLNLAAYGHVSIGPNLYATALGLRVGGGVGAVGAWVAVNGAQALYELYSMLNTIHAKAGPILAAAMEEGPTGICLLGGLR